MPDFNPQITPHNEHFREATSPVNAPHANESTGIALKTIGEGIGGVAKIADQFMEERYKIKAAEGVDEIRNTFTKQLQAATQPQSVIPQPVQGPDGTKVGDPSLLDSNASADVPTAIKNGLNRFGVIQAARDASSGSKDTEYTMKLNSLAVKLRTEAPGYRKYIDEQISSMTGFNPANAVVNSLLSDYKANQTEHEKIWMEAYKGVTDKSSGSVADGWSSRMVADYLLAHRNDPHAISVANQWRFKVDRDKAAVDHQTAVMAGTKLNDDQLLASSKTLMTTQLDSMYNNHFYASTTIGGVTAGKLAEIVTDEGLHPGTHSATEMQQAAQMMAAKRDSLEASMRFEMSKLIVDPSTGKPAVDSRGNNFSHSSVLGAEAEAMVKRKIDGYNTVIQAAVNKETGTALYTATHGLRHEADVGHGIMSDDPNNALAKTVWLGRNMPPGVQDLVLTEAIRAQVGEKLNNKFIDKSKDMFLPDNLKNGKYSTFKGDVTEANTGAGLGDSTPAERAKYATELVNNIKYLGNEPMGPKGLRLDDASQMRAAQYYFRPEGRDVLRTFNQGYWQDAAGKPIPNSNWNNLMPGAGAVWVPGREAVWDKLTNPAVTKNMVRLGKLPGGQQIVKNYIDWAEEEHAQMVTTEIKNLNRFQDNTSGVHLLWNSLTGNFSFVDKNENIIRPNMKVGLTTGNTPQDLQQNYLYKSQPSLDRLNQIGANMKQIQESLGNKEGMSAYYLDLLKRQGFRPNENLKGMDQKFYDAISAGHKQNRIEEVFSKGNQ